MPNFSDNKDEILPLALLDHIKICRQCGGLVLQSGWSTQRHNEWHEELALRAVGVGGQA